MEDGAAAAPSILMGTMMEDEAAKPSLRRFCTDIADILTVRLLPFGFSLLEFYFPNGFENFQHASR